MTRRVLMTVAIVLGVTVFIVIAFSLASNTRLSLSGNSLQDGEATFETDVAGATCRKVLHWGWPPVKLECEEKE
jgi:hypothetical protein